MEELFSITKSLLRNSHLPDAQLARQLGEWALPGNQFSEHEGRFVPSGLPLHPFVETIATTRQLEDC